MNALLIITGIISFFYVFQNMASVYALTAPGSWMKNYKGRMSDKLEKVKEDQLEPLTAIALFSVFALMLVLILPEHCTSMFDEPITQFICFSYIAIINWAADQKLAEKMLEK